MHSVQSDKGVQHTPLNPIGVRNTDLDDVVYLIIIIILNNSSREVNELGKEEITIYLAGQL